MRHFAAVIMLAGLMACQTDPKQSPEYAQLSEDAERANAKVSERDSTLNMLFGTMNRINENLRTIRAKQGQMLDPEMARKAPTSSSG
ncbi:MAG: hypothetical protein IPJ85_07355 [Flavobacteriales bacterium]|nr:hypothetical protein [Flavobacteriales bacterium]